MQTSDEAALEPAPSDEEAKFSTILEDALRAGEDEAVTVGEILDRVADRGFGVIFVLLALPTMIPILPPGASAVVGCLFAIGGAQLMFGAKEPWMPKWVRKHRLSAKTLHGLRTRGIKTVLKVERISRNRWPVMHSNLALRLLGLIVFAIGILLFLPLPFMNTLPGLMMMVVGIGLVNRDGVLMFIGSVVSIALIVVAILFGHLLVELYYWLRNRLFPSTAG